MGDEEESLGVVRRAQAERVHGVLLEECTVGGGHSLAPVLLGCVNSIGDRRTMTP